MIQAAMCQIAERAQTCIERHMVVMWIEPQKHFLH